jgi:hypothetical protein
LAFRKNALKNGTAGTRELPTPPNEGNFFGKRVFVATPAYDGRVLTDYAISLAESCLVGPVNDVFVMASVMGNGAFIDIARNHFVRMFLQSNCTHLFFIDADLRWEPRAFIELVRANKPICAGAYRKRQDPEEYPIRFISNPDGTIKVKDGWIMADRVATGFLCIRRDVIERMVKERPGLFVGNDPECPKLFYEKFIEDSPGKERMVGEDFAFCDDYIRIFGEEIPVWPDFDFTHGARWEGNFHSFLNRKAEEVEAEEKQTSAAA